MTSITLSQILERLESLEVEELQQIDGMVQRYLSQREADARQVAFHRSLIESGLVKQIKPRRHESTEKQVIKVEGKPVSQTIIEERR